MINPDFRNIIFLGLHFGHDSFITIDKNGKIVLYLGRQRLTKNKHHASVKPQYILNFLNNTKILIS